MSQRILAACLTACLTVGLLAATSAPAAATSACREVTVPVSTAEDQPARYRIRGRLCVPAHRPATTVQVLVHGLNYSGLYWDPPYQPDRYSHVRAANRAGYATFALDRLGVGASSHPASTEVTTSANAHTLHQVVTALRERGFDTVVLVGHSYGSEIATLAASRYSDVDALVLTGNASRVSPSAQEGLARLGQPVAEVPRLAARVPAGDTGYVTVRDEQRPLFMYEPAAADPNVIALDVATKETNTLAELATLGDADAPGVTARLTLPILVVDGDADRLVCAPDATDCSSPAALAAAEQPFYPNTRVDAVLVPGAGHALNLHRDAPVAHRRILAWLDRALMFRPAVSSEE